MSPAYIGSYDPGMVGYAASRGGMLTEVVHNPFSQPKREVDLRVAQAMEGAHFGQPMPFFLEAPEGFISPYRIVVVLNAAPNAKSEAVCFDPNQPTRPYDGSVSVLAAFCSQGRLINSVRGKASGIAGADDPTFARLMRQVAILLLPPRDPDRPGGADVEFET